MGLFSADNEEKRNREAPVDTKRFCTQGDRMTEKNPYGKIKIYNT